MQDSPHSMIQRSTKIRPLTFDQKANTLLPQRGSSVLLMFKPRAGRHRYSAGHQTAYIRGVHWHKRLVSISFAENEPRLKSMT